MTEQQTTEATATESKAPEVNPFRKLAGDLPKVPAILNSWGLGGRKTYNKINSDLTDAEEFLNILADFAEKDSFLSNYVSDPEHADDPAVTEFNTVISDIDAEEENDAEEMERRINAIKAEYEAKAKAREERAENAEKEFLAAKPDLLENVPSESERSEAVMQYDLSRAALALTVKKAIDNLSTVERKDADGNVVDVKALLEPLTIPTLKFGGKRGVRTGDSGWKPRFASATINGEAVGNPRVPGLMAALGIKTDRDKFLSILDNQFGRENFDNADTGASFTFTVKVNDETKNVVVVKGNAPAADKAKEDTAPAETESASA